MQPADVSHQSSLMSYGVRRVETVFSCLLHALHGRLTSVCESSVPILLLAAGSLHFPSPSEPGRARCWLLCTWGRHSQPKAGKCLCKVFPLSSASLMKEAVWFGCRASWTPELLCGGHVVRTGGSEKETCALNSDI